MQVGVEEVQGKFRFGGDRKVQVVSLGVKFSCGVVNGVPSEIGLKVHQFGVIVPKLLELNLMSPAEEGRDGLEIKYKNIENEDHKYVEKKTLISANQVTVKASTNHLKDFLVDIDDFREIFKNEDQLKKKKTDKSEKDTKLREFTEFIFEYKMINVLLKDEDELTGTGIRTMKGSIMKKNQNLDVSTDKIFVYLNVIP